MQHPAKLMARLNAKTVKFNTGSGLGEDYRNAIFLARHGSWNRTKKLGGDVVVIKLKDDGSVASIEPFMTGFLENNNYNGRPVDVQMLKDGSLLVSDDGSNTIWRVTYTGAKGGSKTTSAGQ